MPSNTRSPAIRRRPRHRQLVRFILNVIWLIFGGIWLAILYTLAGLVAFILIITIPFGFAAFRMARFCLWPFGRTLVKKDTAGVGSLVGNIVWVVLLGWELALAHLVTGIAQCITIIGIPLGLANFKLIPVSLWPLGRDNVLVEEAHQMGYSGLGIPSCRRPELTYRAMPGMGARRARSPRCRPCVGRAGCSPRTRTPSAPGSRSTRCWDAPARRRGHTRRDLLIGAGGLAAGAALASNPAAALAFRIAKLQAHPRIAIVGAGLAGLRCAHMLWTESPGDPVLSTVYEANPDRAGGRCWTLRDYFAGGLITEHGGSFLNSDQIAIRRLASRLGLEQVVVNGGDLLRGDEVFFIRRPHLHLRGREQGLARRRLSGVP